MVNYYNQRMKQFYKHALVLEPFFKRPEERVHCHTMITRSQKYKKQFNLVVKSINYYNDILLNPDEMAWGTMTEEEADDYFNWISEEQEWGTKSSEMLVWIGYE